VHKITAVLLVSQFIAAFQPFSQIVVAAMPPSNRVDAPMNKKAEAIMDEPLKSLFHFLLLRLYLSLHPFVLS
jgi:hypothetical protein